MEIPSDRESGKPLGNHPDQKGNWKMNTFIRDREQMLSDVKAVLKHGGWEVEDECNDLVVTWNRNDSVRISLDYDRIEYWCEGEW